jgi:hypothetical protein
LPDIPGFWLKNGEVAKFAANIRDPDGYNIEIAYKPWLYKCALRAVQRAGIPPSVQHECAGHVANGGNK